MSVNSTDAFSGPYVSTGTAQQFPFSFNAASRDEVQVTAGGVVVDPTTFTVILNSDGTGAVNATLPANVEVYIESNPDFQQSAQFGRFAPYFPDAVNAPLDRAAIRDIALRDRLDRTFVIPRRFQDAAGKFPQINNLGEWELVDGVPGIAGPAAAFRTNLAALKAASISDGQSTYDGALWLWTPGNFAATPAGQIDVNVVQANGVALTVGAWVRQSASQIQTTFAGVSRTAADKLRDFKSLKDYGAKGDGVTDDTAAIQAALDANWLNGSLDGGNQTYKITSSLKVMRGSRHSGLRNAVFVIGDHVFMEDKPHPTISAFNSIQFFSLDRIFVDAQAHTVVGRRIVDFTRFTRSKFSNLFLFGKDGISIAMYGTGVDGVAPYYNIFSNIETASSHIGIQFDDFSGALDGGCNSNTVTRLRAQPKSGHFGIYIGEGSQNIAVMDSAIEAPSGGTGVYNNGEATRITGNRFESLLAAITWAGGADCGYADGNYYSSNGSNHQFFGNAGARNTILNEKGAFPIFGEQASRVAGFTRFGSIGFGQSTLNHYQEGGFSPALQGTDGNGTTTYTKQIGRFTRVGNIVFVEGYIAWSATTAAGAPRIGGLPFPVLNAADLYVPFTMVPDNFTFAGKLEGIAFAAVDYISLFVSQTGAALTPAAMDTAAGIRFSGVYMV